MGKVLGSSQIVINTLAPSYDPVMNDVLARVHEPAAQGVGGRGHPHQRGGGRHHGASARAMVKALIADKPMDEVLDCKGRLRAGREELFEALSTEQFSACTASWPTRSCSTYRAARAARCETGSVAWVRRLLCEFAQATARTRCALKARFESLAIRKGHKKSVVALAHKMLRTIYAMLSTGSHYQDKTVGLRGPERCPKRPALDEDAAQARLYRHTSRRLILSYPPRLAALVSLRPGYVPSAQGVLPH